LVVQNDSYAEFAEEFLQVKYLFCYLTEALHTTKIKLKQNLNKTTSSAVGCNNKYLFKFCWNVQTDKCICLNTTMSPKHFQNISGVVSAILFQFHFTCVDVTPLF